MSTLRKPPTRQLVRRLVAARAIMQGIRNANSTGPAQIKEAVQKLDMDSFIGRIAFDPKGDL
ncbi:MAG TPA: hypothetical protein VEY08_03605 [Chloroflexia bacterium]|nr:hypothetical protein [Chloroflexia bacterium]